MSTQNETIRSVDNMPALRPGTRVIFHHGKWDRRHGTVGIFDLDPHYASRDWYYTRTGTVVANDDPRIRRQRVQAGPKGGFVEWDHKPGIIEWVCWVWAEEDTTAARRRPTTPPEPGDQLEFAF